MCLYSISVFLVVLVSTYRMEIFGRDTLILLLCSNLCTSSTQLIIVDG